MTATSEDPIPPASRPEEAPATIRPVPNGIGGGLLLFGLIAMLVTPVLLVDAIGKLVVMYDGTLASLKGHALFYIVYCVAMVGLAFCAGFSVYSGSPNGRTMATVFFVANIAGAFLLYLSIPGELPHDLRTTLGQDHLRRIPIPLLWLLYFRLSRRCFYTYSPEYRHLPIRKKPLSRLGKGVLITWGIVVFLAAAVLAGLGVRTATGRAASLPTEVTMTIGGVDIMVPSPRDMRTHQSQNIITEDIVLYHYFIAETPTGFVEYTAGSLAGENTEDWNAINFTYFKNDLKASIEASGNKAPKVGEDKTSIILQSREEHLLDGKRVQVTTAEALVLLNRRLARFTVSATAENPKDAGNLPAIATEWVETIIAANTTPKAP